MTSEKDTSNYAERQSSAGGGLSYTFGAGGLSGSAFASRTKIDSNFDAVGQQTGIVAGDGGFNVNVAGHTQLNGAQIVSPAAEDKNTLTTGTFDFSNIDNTFDSSSSTAGVTLSSGPAIGGPQFAQTSEKKNGSTYAAISPGTITVKADDANGTDSTAGLSRDTSNANQTVQNTFNLRETQNDLAFAQAFGKTATYAMAEAAGSLAKSNPEVFGEGKPGRDVMHAAVAAIGAAISGGNIAGAVGGSLTGDALTALAKPIIDQAVSGLPPGSQEAARNALNVVVATAGGAAAGSLAGGSQGALAGGGSASNNQLYNRQLHPEEKAVANQLAAKSGGRYTEQQIEQQMAQMNLTTGSQTELGSVRVAVGSQPNDGTTWVQYGVNQAGQQVWAQSLPSGDAGLQSYIAKNASGLTYDSTTKAYTQYSAGISGTVMLPFVGAGGGVSVGLQTNGTLRETSPFIQVQANGMASAGAYAGVGGGVGIGHSNGPITTGSSTGGYAELNAGFGASAGANFAISDDGTIGGIGGAAPLKIFPGAGFGAGIGAGKSTSSTFVIPSINDILGRKQ